MYSLAPIANVPDSHIGFYIATFIFLVFIGVLVSDDITSAGYRVRAFIVAAAMFLFIAFVSFTYDESKTYKNEQVTAKFELFIPQMGMYSCGKSTCFSNKVYAQFRLPEGPVVLEVNTAYPMPPYVTLYKN